LDTARAAKDGVKISSILSGISLLQALVRRRLYKVCLTLDRNAYEELNPGSKEEHEIESAIQATLSQLRKDENKRASLESEMAAAAGWPPDSLLLYVPPRKSQAKGIETGALDRGDVLTLGTHSAVRDEVLRLNESYKRLWRMILLVHPKYESDAIGLSKAVDVLVLGIWPAIEKSGIVEGVRKAAWFHYIPEKQRLAAAKYLQMIAPQKPNWAYFDAGSSETTDGTVSTEEHALRALLLSRVVAKGGSATLIRQTFGNPDSLNQRISEVESQLTVEGYEGITDKKAAALDRIASQLVPDPKERRATLFKDNAK